MKKQLFILATVCGLAFFTSCAQEVNTEDFSLPGIWYVTHEYCRVTVDGPEEMKELHERETSLELTKNEAERWTFYNDGTGLSVSKILDEEGYRVENHFSWDFSDSVLSIVIEWLTPGEGGMRAEEYWDVDILTNDKMELFSFDTLGMSNGQGYTWTENITRRLTVEKSN